MGDRWVYTACTSAVVHAAIWMLPSTVDGVVQVPGWDVAEVFKGPAHYVGLSPFYAMPDGCTYSSTFHEQVVVRGGLMA